MCAAVLQIRATPSSTNERVDVTYGKLMQTNVRNNDKKRGGTECSLGQSLK